MQSSLRELNDDRSLLIALPDLILRPFSALSMIVSDSRQWTDRTLMVDTVTNVNSCICNDEGLDKDILELLNTIPLHSYQSISIEDKDYHLT